MKTIARVIIILVVTICIADVASAMQMTSIPDASCTVWCGSEIAQETSYAAIEEWQRNHRDVIATDADGSVYLQQPTPDADGHRDIARFAPADPTEPHYGETKLVLASLKSRPGAFALPNGTLTDTWVVRADLVGQSVGETVSDAPVPAGNRFSPRERIVLTFEAIFIVAFLGVALYSYLGEWRRPSTYRGAPPPRSKTFSPQVRRPSSRPPDAPRPTVLQPDVSLLRSSLADLSTKLRDIGRDLGDVRSERDELKKRVAVVPQREAELDAFRRSLYAKEAELLGREQYLGNLINKQKEQLAAMFSRMANGGRS
jgi:hypothetical protein